jgi:NAD(P)H-dependent flavin oxidoreductase YrpB (nitropropane dioxygenase family)
VIRTPLCAILGVDHPIVAFSHSREVVAAVSRAGGLGVFGAARFDADELEEHLAWIDQNCGPHRYGVDVVMAAVHEGGDKAELRGRIPEGHRAFVDGLRRRFDIPPLSPAGRDREHLTGTHPRARQHIDVALRHPLRLLVSALGPAPRDVVDRAHAQGVLVGGMCGSVGQARQHLDAGTDVVVAQGTEAGGHTGEIATMVLVSEVVDAVAPVPVLAAGGIGRGRQVAAALALGAQGAWTGSVWLTTGESGVDPVVKEKLLAAQARDAVRSRCMTGKPVRQLRTPWVAAWESPDAPRPLPMPLQELLVYDAARAITEHRVTDLMGSPVGQIVGSMTEARPAADVLNAMVAELEATVAGLCALSGSSPHG